MKANEIKSIALEIVKDCYTCAAVKSKYPILVDKYGKDNAKTIIQVAKSLLKNHKVVTAANAAKVVESLKDGQRVLNSTWSSILKDKEINTFAVIVARACNNDLLQIIDKYARYKDDNGKCAIKHINKNKVVTYTLFDINNCTPVCALSLMKQAIKNAKLIAINGAYKYKVVSISE